MRMSLRLEIPAEGFLWGKGGCHGRSVLSIFSCVWAGDDSEASGLNAYLYEQLPTCYFRNKEM